MATEGTTKSQDSDDQEQEDQGQDSSGGGQNRRPAKKSASGPPRMKASAVARAAAEELAGLTGRQPESVTGLEHVDHGWKVTVEVVEARRIPDSTDILALYEVQLDIRGELVSYQRLRRYSRGRTGEE